MPTSEERAERIRVIRVKIAEIKKRLPKHTPTMAMMVELDEAEYELHSLLAEEQASEIEPGGRDTDRGGSGI